MKMLAIVRMRNGEPDWILPSPTGGQPAEVIKGYALAGHLLLGIQEWGVYILTGPERMLADLRKQEGLYEMITLLGAGRTYQDGSLDTPLPADIRNRINAWIAENTTWDEIPPGRTARQAVVEVFRRFNPFFDLSRLEIMNYE